MKIILLILIILNISLILCLCNFIIRMYDKFDSLYYELKFKEFNNIDNEFWDNCKFSSDELECDL